MSSKAQQRHKQKRFTVQHNNEIEDQLNSETVEANWDKALQYREKMLLRDENDEPYPLKVETTEFSKFGVGLQLFFDFVRFSAIIFFIMALVSTPAIVSNVTGDGLALNYSSQANSYGALTIANQPELVLISPSENATDEQVAEIKTENNKRIDDFVIKMDERQYWVIIPDIVYTCIFIIFIFLWRRRSKQIKKESMVSESVPSHYTIYAWGFPKDVTDNNVVKQHFEKFGHIQECKIVRNYYGTLFDHKKEANIEHQIATQQRRNELKVKQGKQPNEKKIEKMEEKRDLIQQQIAKTVEKKVGNIVSNDQYPAIGAYVVFNTIQDKQKCVEAYDNAHALCGDKDELCFMDGTLLKVRGKVDEPSNIKWENLDATSGERCARLTCVFFSVLAVMLLTFSVIFIANIVKPSNNTNCPSDTTYTLEEAQAANDKDTTTCFCRQQDLSTLQNDLVIQEFCWDIYVEYISLTILTIATAMTVIMVNFLLKVLLRSLGKFSKFATITKETLGITVTLFLAMFINTAIITLLLQAEIFGFTPAIYISKPIPPLSDLQDEKATQFSADFDRPWYVEVGAKITITMFANIFSPHLIFWSLLPIFKSRRTKKAKKQVIQKDMNTFVLGPQFNVTGYYASVLNTMFTTMFYCSGVPILLYFGAASLTIQYWIYKYYILRYNKKPPSYDNKLNKKIISILPLAAILHLMIGIYMYGSPLIFPASADDINTATSTNSNTTTVEGDSSISQIGVRISNQLLMFLLLVVCILLQIIDRTLVVILKKCYKVLFCVKKKNKLASVNPDGEKTGKQLFGSFQEEYELMSKRMLSSYDIRLNEEYAPLIKAIEDTKQKHDKTPKRVDEEKQQFKDAVLVDDTKRQEDSQNKSNKNNNNKDEIDIEDIVSS